MSRNKLFRYLTIVLLVFTAQIQLGNCDLSLTLLHTNDVHARFAEIDTHGQPCSKQDSETRRCFGGFARLYQKAEEIRKTHPNVIYLNGGDYYQGTVWYTLFKWEVVAYFVNKLNHTAMALGNHEFDDNIDGVVPFLNNVSFPVLSCNIDDTNEPKIHGRYNKSVVVEYEGVQVGIIGYTTPETKDISNPGKLVFKNITESVAEEAKRLYEEEKVKIIFAVGHAGFEVDLEVAKVPYIDFVVGGHTNTFLYTGTPPSVDVPEGKYPTIVTQANGRKVPVVQAYAYGKYLGYLNLKFDSHGELKSWEGNPILLDSSVAQDSAILADVNEWSKKVAQKVETEIGRTRVFLDGSRMSCRMKECNLGNAITDAMVFTSMKDDVAGAWTDVSMAIVHSGSIRASISEKSKNGSITLGDLLHVSPFGHTVDVIEIKGEHLRKTFEFSVQGLDLRSDDPSGRFLQVSGIRIVYDLSRPAGNRVKKIDVLCQRCRVPVYRPLSDNEVYRVVVPGYLVEGGGGFDVLKNHTLVHTTSGQLDLDTLIPYFQAKSPITQGIEGRIMFETNDIVANKCSEIQLRRQQPQSPSSSAIRQRANSSTPQPQSLENPEIIVPAPAANKTTMSSEELKLRQKILKLITQLEELQERGLSQDRDGTVDVDGLVPNTTSVSRESDPDNSERSIILDALKPNTNTSQKVSTK